MLRTLQILSCIRRFVPSESPQGLMALLAHFFSKTVEWVEEGIRQNGTFPHVGQYHRSPPDYLDIPGKICMVLAHVAEWEPYYLHDLATCV